MTRELFVQEMNRQLKLVRTEYGFTQETMANVLGLSKKTLVEIEKGRSSLGWMGAAA
ncbi:transcriptional regulator, partial [Klebsiella oxytoca]